MENIEEQEEISKADMLVALLQNEGKSEFHGLVKGITVRLPIHQYAAIESFSRHTGMSKNKVVCELLEVAVHTAVSSLDRTNRRAFNKHQSDVLTELSAEGYGENVSAL